MTSDTPADRPAGPRSRRGRTAPPSRLRRRLGAAARMIAALALAGGVFTAFAPGSQAEDTPQLSDAGQRGKALFDNTCISCHGRNAQGVEARGPSLIRLGSASVYFQVSSGRMPMGRQEAQAERKPVQFDDAQTRQLGQYIQELGGGPEVPEGSLSSDVAKNPESLSRGGELFRINCTSCHAFGGAGGALSSGEWAPSPLRANDKQIYAAMLSGPQNMPVFGDNQLSPEEKREIIAYINHALKANNDPGGFNLGRYGPVTEGLAIFLVGVTALVFASLWIAGKS